MQHKSVDKTFDFYQLISYLQVLLYSLISSKRSFLQNALWHKDINGAHDQVIRNETINPGEHWRSSMSAGSRTMHMQGRLLLDCLNFARPLVENVGLTLQFVPHDPNDCLVAIPPAAGPIEYKVEILDCYLLVPRLKVKPSLLKSIARYPWVKTEVMKFIHPANVTNFNARTVYNGPNIPRRAFVVLLGETRYERNSQLNRLRFMPMDVAQMLMTVNDEHKPVHNGYISDFPNYNYTEVYAGLFNELNKNWDPNSIDISWADFRNGYTIWAFDLSSNKTSSADFYAPAQSGTVQLRIRFNPAQAETVVVLVFLEHEHMLTIDKNRNWEDKESHSKH
jgi:hypothetical protein